MLKISVCLVSVIRLVVLSRLTEADLSCMSPQNWKHYFGQHPLIGVD